MWIYTSTPPYAFMAGKNTDSLQYGMQVNETYNVNTYQLSVLKVSL
jgi:hypothetical protein